MPKNTFNNFFVSELQRLYGQEKKLTRVLARFGEAAKAPDLKSSFARELREAETHINRLEEVFQAVGQKPAARSCPRVDGMFEECDRVADLAAEPAVHDVALLAAGQHLEQRRLADIGAPDQGDDRQHAGINCQPADAPPRVHPHPLAHRAYRRPPGYRS